MNKVVKIIAAIGLMCWCGGVTLLATMLFTGMVAFLVMGWDWCLVLPVWRCGFCLGLIWGFVLVNTRNTTESPNIEDAERIVSRIMVPRKGD